MSVALSITNVIGARRRTVRHFGAIFSGSYVTGGDTVDFTAATNPNGIAAARAFSRLPDSVVVQNLPGGYAGEIVPGAALNSYKLKLYTASATELAAGAYPAALTAAAAVQLEVVSKVNV